MTHKWNDKIFSVKDADFTGLALEIFNYQYGNNEVYRLFTDALGIDVNQVTCLERIPFLPVDTFKNFGVKTGLFVPQLEFVSSGTSGSTNSRHLVKDQSLYEESFSRCFEKFYGPARDWCIIGLLPSYLERTNSSLVYMVDALIKQSGHDSSGFYLHDKKALAEKLQDLESKKEKTLLIGVSFALLEMAKEYPLKLEHTIVMETGGMKGRGAEVTREELHGILRNSFGLEMVHSEYGMTELLSQAYSKENGIFHAPSWMKIMIRDEEDPFLIKSEGSGIINIIDLANVHSCSFLATDDAGRLYGDGSFEVLGRVDNSDIRGCNLMVTEV